jgi:4-amino-4-deoxy-L-arabinose transferase-like glycosyltransferase
VKISQFLTPQWVSRHRLLIPLAIAGLGLTLNIIVASNMAPTTDEMTHLRYGFRIMQGSPDLSFNGTMPISVLNGVPAAAGNRLRRLAVTPSISAKLRDFRAARYPTIFAAFGLCLLVYVYTESLFGRVAGLFAQFLFAISPNIIAHSTLATLDLYIALTTVLFLYCFRRFLLFPSASNAALAAFTLALAQLTKFSAVFLYFVFLVVISSVALYSKYGYKKPLCIPARQISILLVLNVVCFVGLVNAGFLFDRTLTPLAKYEFRSEMFQALQNVPFLHGIPLPVPYPYVQGFDWMNYHNVTGLDFGNIVLFGEARGRELARSDGFLSYYLVSYILKEPLGMQLLLLFGLLWVVRYRRFADFLTGEWPLLVTAGIFLLMLSLFNNAQVGIRHILPVLVILVILSGAAFSGCLKANWRRRALLGACILWVLLSVFSYYPHMIPYFNELIVDRKLAYRFLADSNLDWGQNTWVVDTFLNSNPDVLLDPPQPVAGRVLVSANLLAGVSPAKADYWLRISPLKPVDHVGYGHLLFDIPPGEVTR